MTRCNYVIDRAFGGYLSCIREAGHEGRHCHGRMGKEARSVVGDSWVTIEQWRQRCVRKWP